MPSAPHRPSTAPSVSGLDRNDVIIEPEIRGVLLRVLALAFAVDVIGTVFPVRRLRRAPFDTSARRSIILLAVGDFGLLVALAVAVAHLGTGQVPLPPSVGAEVETLRRPA